MPKIPGPSITDLLKEEEKNRTPDEPSLLGEAAKGFASGVVGLAESVGTGIEYLGGKLKDQDLVDLGDSVYSYWNDVNQRNFQADESLRGPIYDPEKGLNTELLSKGAWWAYNVANIVPSVAASYIPGAAVEKGAMALRIGERAVRWTPAVVTKLGRLGRALKSAETINRGIGAAAGGLVGGALEGSSTYQEILQRGGTREEAASGAEQMTLASAALNMISLNQMLKNLPKGVVGNATRRMVNGLTEGLTEWLEEPSEAYIKMRLADKGQVKFTPEEAVQQIYQGLNVLPPSVITGMLFGGGAPATTEQVKGNEPVVDYREVPEVAGGPLTTAAQRVNVYAPLNEEGAMRRAQVLSEQGVPHEAVPHPTIPNKFAVMPVEEVQDASEVRGDQGQVLREVQEERREPGELSQAGQNASREDLQRYAQAGGETSYAGFGLKAPSKQEQEAAAQEFADMSPASRLQYISSVTFNDDLKKQSMGDVIDSEGLSEDLMQSRRRQHALRANIEEMTPEEQIAAIKVLREMATTSRLTGLKNKDAFEEMYGENFDAEDRPKFVASIDSDALKAVNDLMGHKAGDALLRATGIALGEEKGGAEAFHLSGDEFALTGNDRVELEQSAKRAQERLKGMVITGTDANGRQIELHGIGFSYGIAENLQEAEHALIQDKARREQAGERAPRGELPRGIRIAGGQEQADTGAPAAEEKVIGPYQEEKGPPKGGVSEPLPTSETELEGTEKPVASVELPPEKKEARQQIADNFNTRYKRVPVGEVKVGVKKVTTPEEAAHVFSSMRKRAEENFYTLVTDKNGNILDLQMHSKGTKDGASVYPEIVGPAVASVPGAANVFFAHNHPSGVPDPSRADYQITERLTKFLDGANVNFAGHIVIGRSNNAWYFKDAFDENPVQIKPRVRNKTVSITERMVRRIPKDEEMTDIVAGPDDTRRLLKKVSAENALLLFDNRHRFIGSLAMTPTEMKRLRVKSRVNRILKAIDTTNAAAAIVKTTDKQAGDNMSAYLSDRIRLLDVLLSEKGGDAYRSFAETGEIKESGPFASVTVKGKPRYKTKFVLDTTNMQVAKKSGRITGAPTPLLTQANVEKQAEQVLSNVETPMAMPETSPSWYERSGKFLRDMSRGNEELMERMTRIIALMSPDTGVQVNFTHAVNYAYDLALNPNVVNEWGSYPNNTQKAIELGALDLTKEFTREMWGVGPKVESFYRNLHDEAFNEDKYPGAVTIDRWMARALGYPGDRVAETQYEFAAELTRQMTEEYNRRHGTDLKPRQLQAMIWVHELNDTFTNQDPNYEPSDFSFAEAGSQSTSTIMVEAIPSEKIAPELLDLGEEQSRKFTEESLALIRDKNGNDEILDRIGVPLYRARASEGAYAGGIHPNAVIDMVARKYRLPNGIYDRELAHLYSKALQYVFSQDSVVVERAVFNPDDISKYNRAFYIEFSEPLKPDAEQTILGALNEVVSDGVGFTRIDDNSIKVINIPDYTGLNDDVFYEKMQGIINDRHEELGIVDAYDYWSQTNFDDPEAHHDWEADREGSALEKTLQEKLTAALGESRGQGVLSWLQRTRAAHQALIEKYRGAAAEQGEEQQVELAPATDIISSMSENVSVNFPEEITGRARKFTGVINNTRIIGTVSNKRIVVNIIAGTNGSEIDALVREVLGKAYDAGARQTSISLPVLQKNQSLAATMSTLDAQKVLVDTHVDNNVAISTIKSRPPSIGIVPMDAMQAADRIAYGTNFDELGDYSLDDSAEPVSDKYLKSIAYLFDYKRSSEVYNLSSGEREWIDVTAPSDRAVQVVAKSIKSLTDAGFPAPKDIGVPNIMVGYFSSPAHNGFYDPKNQSITMPSTLVEAIAELNGTERGQRGQHALTAFLAHEMTHSIDFRKDTYGLSYTSEYLSFEATDINPVQEVMTGGGSVIRELFNYYMSNDNETVSGYLNYPLNRVGQYLEIHHMMKLGSALGMEHTQNFRDLVDAYANIKSFIQSEALAQLSGLYWTHKEFVRENLPEGFKMMEDFANAIKQIKPDSGDDAVRDVLRSRSPLAGYVIGGPTASSETTARGAPEETAGERVREPEAATGTGRRIPTASSVRSANAGEGQAGVPQREAVGTGHLREAWDRYTESISPAKSNATLSVARDNITSTPPNRALRDSIENVDDLVSIAETAKEMGSGDTLMQEVIRVDLGIDSPLSAAEHAAVQDYAEHIDEYTDSNGIVTYHDDFHSGSVVVGPVIEGVANGKYQVVINDAMATVGTRLIKREFDKPTDALMAGLVAKYTLLGYGDPTSDTAVINMPLNDFLGSTTGPRRKELKAQHYMASMKAVQRYVDSYRAFKEAERRADDTMKALSTKYGIAQPTMLWLRSAITDPQLYKTLSIEQQNVVNGMMDRVAEYDAARTKLSVDQVPDHIVKDYPGLADMMYRENIRQNDMDNLYKKIDDARRMFEGLGEDQVKSSMGWNDPPRYETGTEADAVTEAAANENFVANAVNKYQQVSNRVIDYLGSKFSWADPLGDLKNADEYLAKRRRAAGKIGKINTMTKRIFDILHQATPEEASVIYKYLTTVDSDMRELPNRTIKTKRIRGTGMLFRQPTEVNLRKEVVAIKRLIDKVGRDLVEHGLIPPMSYEHFRYRYLPRMYLAHILDEGTFRAITSGRKVSRLGYTKARDENMPELVRIIKGEITEPSYLAAKGLGTSMRDIAILDFLDDISKESDWVMPQVMVTYNDRRVSAYWLESEGNAILGRLEYMSDADKAIAQNEATNMISTAQKVLQEVGPVDSYEGYKQVPNTPRYGHLRGMYVRQEIYDDLIGSMATQMDDSVAGRILGQGGYATKLTQLWKMSKVALNPPTQVRNFVSNAILVQLSGTPMHKIPGLVFRALDEIRHNGKYWRLAQREGLTESTFAANELYRLDRSLLDLKKATGDYHTLDMLKNVAGSVTDAVGDAYQFSEALFKVVKVIDAMEREGLSASDAAAAANDTLFDYSHVPASVRYLRNAPVGIPFITFYYKVLPNILKTAIRHPQRFLPYVAIPWMMAQALASHMDVDDDDLDKLKKALPEWLQQRGHTMILPTKDEHGRWVAFDYGYMVPWGMYWDAAKDIGRGEPGELIKTMGLFGGPLPNLITAITTGKDPFTGRDIYRAEDPASKQFGDIMNYLWRMAMPTFITDIGAAGHIYRNLTGHVDPRTAQPQLTLPQAAMRTVGMNLYPIDPEYSRLRNIMFKQAEIRDIMMRGRSRAMDANLSAKEKRQVLKTYNDMAVKKIEELKRYMKESYVNPKLRVKKDEGIEVPNVDFRR